MTYFYPDPLYGKVLFPKIVLDLAQTKIVRRTQGISLDSLPAHCVPWKVTNRYTHGFGTCALASIVIANNDLPKQIARKILISSFLHDAGNGPFSHLCEPFMRQVTGKDGESFLEEMLDGSDAAHMIEEMGFSVPEIVDFVTGKSKPYSPILHGSMDVDNLDNVGRYWFTAAGEVRFNAPLIASSYRFKDGEWFLPYEILEECRKWQKTRELMYGMIYSKSHFAAMSMLGRALYLSLVRGYIDKHFFKLDDNTALEYLRRTTIDSRILVDTVISGMYHEEAFSIETTEPSNKLKKLVAGWDSRHKITDYIVRCLGIPNYALCVMISKGVDKRRIELPFLQADGWRYFDSGDYDPTYRVKLYVDPEYKNRVNEMIKLIRRIVLD